MSGVPLSAQHGWSRTPTYRCWVDMRARCACPTHKWYDYYGGRGIAVCARWSSFEAFLADMGQKPKGLTLDRIDNSKGYEPGNCRWATRSEQNLNKRKLVGTSLHKGVFWDSRRARWRVSLHLGLFENESEAAQVYKQAVTALGLEKR